MLKKKSWLTQPGDLATSRRRSLEALQTACVDLVAELEGVKGCSFPRRAQESLDCRSLQFGSLLLALRKLGGDNWRTDTLSGRCLTQYHSMFLEVAKRGKAYSALIHSDKMPGTCTWGERFQETIDRIYDKYNAGRRLKDYGGKSSAA